MSFLGQIDSDMDIKPIRKILVANRGEIAVRVIRACREMRISSTAIYSNVDRSALHVRLADEAIWIGEADPAHSYLDSQKIIQAALNCGAQAIHPGYGLLSENKIFARQVEDAGLVFIGPPPEAIGRMGDKGSARQAMEAAGIPVLPGYHAQDDEESFLKAAQSIGYPVLVKASAGGGGKGMRLAWEAAELPEAMAACRREAKNAFGDDRLILEAFIPQAHHIEIQILADRHGNIVHLFERECSVQRRHQKIIEETPSPNLDPVLRSEMGQVAVKVSQAVGYINAGTVEFIFDPRQRRFYFLEMNTRLQVEHPITELVVGIDLVQWQIRIAAGEPIPFTQGGLSQRGHAIECRLYAEDPDNDFLPATGPLLSFKEPIGPGIRFDSGYRQADEITIYYDPLIAKLISHGEDRGTAIRRMAAGLNDLVILGLPTNQNFLTELIASDAFHTGTLHTTWVEENYPDQPTIESEIPPEVWIAAALIELDKEREAGKGKDAIGGDPYNPWMKHDGFRPGRLI